MLGRMHTSDEHLFIPRLIFLDATKSAAAVFKLDWDKVDEHKRRRSNEIETLPAEYDNFVKQAVYSISTSYQVEIEHCTLLYYTERHRIRHFDTMIRDMCADIGRAAINCAFKLLVDCAYDNGNHCWFRGNQHYDRLMLRHLLLYKFWRENVGRGLVWHHAEFDRLEEVANFREQRAKKTLETAKDNMTKVGAIRSTVILDAYADRNWAAIYRQCLTNMRLWEQEQEKYYPVGPPVENLTNPQQELDPGVSN